MWIKNFSINNYKCFYSTEPIGLSPAFNVIVGQNNVGKTALLQALSVNRLRNAPHRSQSTVPVPGNQPRGNSQVQLTVEISGNELRSLLLRETKPFGLNVRPDARETRANNLRDFYERLGEGSFQVNWTVVHGANIGGARLAGFTDSQYPTMSVAITSDNILQGIASYNLDTLQASERNENRLIQSLILEEFKQRIYLFDAERLNLSQFDIGADDNLLPNATNLAQVLHYLSTRNPARFHRFVSYVQRVFPEITAITVPPISASVVEIEIWTIDPSTERNDLAFALAESGTGIGQVLAILYIIVTADEPKVILIDEPQSFLHPGAIRKLFEILQGHPEHQYGVTTHSATAITAAEPQNLLLVRKNELESSITRMDATKTKDITLMLREIGAQLSDVFGADNILWVEGETEEICFPKILSAIARKPLLGTFIKGVVHTGDFDSKSRKRMIEIYEGLSAGVGILPPAVGFIFDHEKRRQEFIDELNQISRNKIFFLGRRMYECYLLDWNALADLMSTLENFSDAPISEADIEQWIEDVQWNREYIGNSSEKSPDYWIQHVDAARLLKDMFSHFSETRYEFDKLIHSVALTEWIIERNPTALQDVANLIANALDTGRQQLSD